MATVIQEIERLKPVYETGVLRLLRRERSMIYVALLRAAFDPLTGELPRETLEECFAQSITQLITSGDWPHTDGDDIASAAHRVLTELTREGDGEYAWLANTLDSTSHRYLYRLTARAHRAIEALHRLQEDSPALSGAQANSIIMEIEHARVQLTADPEERIQLLNREIAARREEIERLTTQGTAALPDPQETADIIAVVHNTLRGVPVDLRELALAERDHGDMLRRRMQAGMLSADDILNSYHEEYRHSFHHSDAGRRFDDAFHIIVTEEGRRQIDEAIHAIAQSPCLKGSPGALLSQVREELHHIYDGIEDVRRQTRVSDEAVSRLIRQQTDTRYRTMMTRLNRLYAALCATITTPAEADMSSSDQSSTPSTADNNDPVSARYLTQTAEAQFPALPVRPSRPIRRAAPPRVHTHEVRTATPMSSAELKRMIESGGPRLRHIIGLIRTAPVMRGGLIDMAASFNRLPAAERRESELIGVFGAFRSSRDSRDAAYADWNCVSLRGTPSRWRTRMMLVNPDELDTLIREA